MAQDTMDVAMDTGKIGYAPSTTKHLPLIGAVQYHDALYSLIAREFQLPVDVAEHLCHAYGAQAVQVAQLAREQKLSKRLADGYPYIEAEVLHACRNEYSMTLVDALARRMRLAFLDPAATLAATERVTTLMAAEYKWNAARKRQEQERLKKFCNQSMGLEVLQSCSAKQPQ